MCGKNYKVFATLQYKFLNSEAVDIQVEKTTRPFRYDLNQIPYHYTIEVRNRFKSLDQIDRVPEEQWIEVPDLVQEARMKTFPKKNKCKKAK